MCDQGEEKALNAAGFSDKVGPMRTLLQTCIFYWRTLWLVACIGSVSLAQADVAGPDTHLAAGLRAQFTALEPQLSNNQFNRPLSLNSAESSNRSKGEIYALVDYPFATVKEALIGPAHWCDVLILHLNTKYCHASTHNASNILAVSIGKKSYQAIDDAYLFEFVHSVATTTPEYFNVLFNAKTGPLGTSDYLLMLEAVSVQGGKTFLHLTYSYAFDFQGRLAMLAYLSTLGRGKVGFTQTAKPSSGQPDYIGGVRGAVERNTMRYYLAIDAYLGALSTPPAAQLEKRLQSWFNATEQFPRQLHEVDRDAYLTMKRREVLRMQKPPGVAD